MQAAATIPSRFNGPPTSGNGGYTCGLLATHIAGAARIRLHTPPPLETALQLSTQAGGAAQLSAGETLVGSGESAVLALDIPVSPSLEEARKAMEGFPCYQEHNFPTCFVCGTERHQHDGLELFPGPLPQGKLWACLWRPAADLLDAKGNVRPEIVWAALDCPGYFATLGEQLRPALLGELVAELHSDIAGAQDLVVYAWSLGSEGRKFYAGTAIATATGDVVASAKSTWITLKA